MTQTQGASKVKYPASLPLEVSKAEDDAKTLMFKLFSNPGDTTSPKVNKTIRVIDGSEDLRTIIQFKLDSRIVCHGLKSAGAQPSIRLWTSLWRHQHLLLTVRP